MRSDHLLLRDILEFIAEIGRYLPRDRSAFDSNPLLQSHIHRHVMIIGEAAYRLSVATKARAPDVPWRRVEGMRHILVHDYFKVDWNEVYTTARKDVPAPKSQIEGLLMQLGGETP
jgi:uncharacterized protein with HEPN domain